MHKHYDHQSSEDKIYDAWMKSGRMRADALSPKPKYTIPIPPPNVTGTLHLGHAAMLAIEDILIRYKKMSGYEALWIPGTDHAAIATENVVLKHLGRKSREEMTREDFLAECRTFAGEKHDTIVNQMKKMGAWLDWSREAYTFDDERNFSVNYIFKKLYEDNLIERGHRMINWSTGAQSVLSDDELEWGENETMFYEFWCGPFLIGTVRTETKCADSPLVVNPDAEYVRAKNSEGRELIVSKFCWEERTELRKDFELVEIIPQGKDLAGMEFEYETYAGKRKFYVLPDEVVDPKFGTGAMTISTSHDPHDFDMAKRYKLPMLQKIDFKGKMTSIAGECEGLPVNKARLRSAEIMEEKGLLFHKRPYTNRVPKCYRSGCIVEPMVSPQWFISVEKEFTDKFTGKKTTLKKQMQEAVREKHVEIIPAKFEKVYFQWIDNLRDWCISRQIWWGHRIPVWYDEHQNIHLPAEKTMLFVRHGESEANVEKVIGGDYSLTNNGKKTAEDIFNQAKKRKITKVICSDLNRGKETAEIVAELFANDVQVEVWPELNEFFSLELAEKAGDDLKREGPIQFNFDQIQDENLEQVQARAQAVFEKLQKENTDETLVIGHKNMTAAIFHFAHSSDTEKFVGFRKKWSWEKGTTKELLFLKEPESEGPKAHFVRHGESEWNQKGLIQGHQLGINLTELGQDQAKETVQLLKGKNIKKIVSSDLDRAQQTAEVIKSELGLDVEIELWPELREWGLGEMETKTMQEVFQEDEFNYLKTAQSISQGSWKGAETMDDLEARAKAVWAKLKDISDETLVVSHGGFMRVLSCIKEQGSLDNFEKDFATRTVKNAELISHPLQTLTQDEDTLDTWFSSALWPFSTVGWPNTEDPDFEAFYPNDVLETGHDILFFWVARMIMFGRYATGKYPFHTVYLHGMVCDEKGKKMSKSKGNGIDPLEVISEVGADAVRLSLVIGSTPGNPIPLGKAKIEGYRNFVNKMWNAGRFVQMQIEGTEFELGDSSSNLSSNSLSEKWILSRFSEVSASVSQKLENYDISGAGDDIYHFVWDEFCNWYLECQKVEKNPEFLFQIFAEVLKLAHPLVPFVTEKLWEELYSSVNAEFIIEQGFPSLKAEDKGSCDLFAKVQEIVTEIRKIRADKGLNPKEKLSVIIKAKDAVLLGQAKDLITVLAGLSELTIGKDAVKPDGSAVILLGDTEVFVEIPFDAEAEKIRLEKSLTDLQKQIDALEGRLSNKKYVDNAPEKLVVESRDQLEKLQTEKEKVVAALKQL